MIRRGVRVPVFTNASVYAEARRIREAALQTCPLPVELVRFLAHPREVQRVLARDMLDRWARPGLGVLAEMAQTLADDPGAKIEEASDPGTDRAAGEEKGTGDRECCVTKRRTGAFCVISDSKGKTWTVCAPLAGIVTGPVRVLAADFIVFVALARESLAAIGDTGPEALGVACVDEWTTKVAPAVTQLEQFFGKKMPFVPV
jgi:hypothetical protein